MNVWDFVIIAIIALIVVLAIISIRRNQKKGKTSCGGDCASCNLCEGRGNRD